MTGPLIAPRLAIRAALSAVFLCAGLGAASPAEGAQGPVCDVRHRVIAHLAKTYKEAPVAIGVTNAGAQVEVLSADDGRTWTIIVSYPDGRSCFLSARENWRRIEPSHEDPEA